jgi:ribose transport system permease protein
LQDTKMTAAFDFARLPRQNVPRMVISPRRIAADILSRGWIESAIPFAALGCVVAGILLATDDYFAAANLFNLTRYAADGGLIVLALLTVVAVGGIDLSVGSNFALSAFAALYAFHLAELPVPAVLAVSLAMGALVGVVNGILAGLIGCGALLTTLGTMITIRGLYTLASQAKLVEISSSARMDDAWDWIGFETVLSLPVGFWVLLIAAAAVFVMFRQSRLGWHVLAVGGNRKAARHSGIRVKLTVFLAYVLAGTIVGLAGFLYAARQNSVGSDTGIGMEFFALTALVVGLGGFVPGRGAVVPALVGFATVYILNNVLINAGLRGDFVQFTMGAILIVILAIDVRFRKNRHRLLAASYVDPVALQPAPVQGMAGLMPDDAPPRLAGAALLATGPRMFSWTATA